MLERAEKRLLGYGLASCAFGAAGVALFVWVTVVMLSQAVGAGIAEDARTAMLVLTYALNVLGYGVAFIGIRSKVRREKVVSLIGGALNSLLLAAWLPGLLM